MYLKYGSTYSVKKLGGVNRVPGLTLIMVYFTRLGGNMTQLVKSYFQLSHISILLVRAEYPGQGESGYRLVNIL